MLFNGSHLSMQKIGRFLIRIKRGMVLYRQTLKTRMTHKQKEVDRILNRLFQNLLTILCPTTKRVVLAKYLRASLTVTNTHVDAQGRRERREAIECKVSLPSCSFHSISIYLSTRSVDHALHTEPPWELTVRKQDQGLQHYPNCRHGYGWQGDTSRNIRGGEDGWQNRNQSDK